MQNSRPDAWQRWYQSAAYAVVGLISALAMIILVASEKLPWYLYVLPIIFAFQSIERFVQAKKSRRADS